MGLFTPKVQSAERTIRLGSSKQQLPNNQVFTAKYTALNFIPKCLFLQFLRLSNVVFLANAVLQSIPILSSMTPLTAIGPLGFVLLISMVREAYEDRKRHLKDNEINSRLTRVLRGGVFEQVVWECVKVGDIVKVRNGEIVPTDMLLLYSTQENSMCFVDTSNLDGQSNLKQKFAFQQGLKLFPEQFESLEGEIIVDAPNPCLYDLNGKVRIGSREQEYIGMPNVLLRQTTLRNSEEVVGVTLYCGYDTKILQNQGEVHHKMSQIEQKLNHIQIVFLLILGLICATCSIGYSVIHTKNNLRDSGSYIPIQSVSLPAESGLNFLTVFFLLNFLIPISLVILMEGIKTFSGIFLSADKKMLDPASNTECGVLNSSILEELGVVDYVLTDKTGTLTANEMMFRTIAVQNKVYNRDYLFDHQQEMKKNQSIHELFLSMVICHDVVRDHLKDEIQGSSPDQVCFVNFSQTIGYQFKKRTQTHLELNIHNQKVLYGLVDILPFNNRKRMSVAVKRLEKPDQIIVYTKGADSAVFQKALDCQNSYSIDKNINNFAKQGLRTLLFAKRVVSSSVYQEWLDRKEKIKRRFIEKLCSKEEYSFQMDRITQEVEDKLSIIGATGIEDRLQEEVPETIERLQRAGIVVMMITGDKLETAENIGYLARLIREDFHVVRLVSDLEDLPGESEKLLSQITNDVPVSVIIEGKQISRMMKEKDPVLIKLYSGILMKARSVIFCRSSPRQKAEIVQFVKENMKAVVLAIGDGGNDVGMIEEAHIGVGIIGKEGNSAASVSDFSLGRFKMLDRLLLHHGRWFYYRLSYFFIFYGWKNIIITFIMFLSNVQNSFSGIINFTELFYVLYNSFFAIAQIIHSGLYEQDINDDLHPAIYKYLPEIYKQTKQKQLFSYKRYTMWSLTAVLTAILINQIVIHSLSPLQAVDYTGQIPDRSTEKIANGIILVTVIIMVNYLDTQSHTFLFEAWVFFGGSLLVTGSYYLGENFLAFLGYYQVYTDNCNMRFFLTILLAVMIVFLAKLLVIVYEFEQAPTIIDLYKINRLKNQNCLDQILGGKSSFLGQSLQAVNSRRLNARNAKEMVKIEMVQQEMSHKSQKDKFADSSVQIRNESIVVPISYGAKLKVRQEKLFQYEIEDFQ